jgi:hypothetical protein
MWGPAAENNGCWACFKFYKKVRKQPLLFVQMPHLNKSLSRIVCKRQEGPKGSKGTLRPDFQAKNT